MLCHSSMSVSSAPSIESELVLKKCWWFHVLRKAWFTTGLSLYFSSSLCFSVCIRNSSTEGKRSCGRRGGWQYLMYTLQTVGDLLWVSKGKRDHPQHQTCLLHCTATVPWNCTKEGALGSTCWAPLPLSSPAPQKQVGDHSHKATESQWLQHGGGESRGAQGLGMSCVKTEFARWHFSKKRVLYNSKRRGKRNILLPLTPSKQG